MPCSGLAETVEHQVANLQRYKGLIGSLACFWYINEDIPDINSFRDRRRLTTWGGHIQRGWRSVDSAPPIPAARGSRCLREELSLLAGDLTILPATSPSPARLQLLELKHCDDETLAIVDSKLGNAIKEKLKIGCVHNSDVMELMRGLRNQLSELISGLGTQDLDPRSLGLSHSLSRYKLKFSPKKVRNSWACNMEK
ncbi:nucleolar protein 58 isoform X1 [Aegilops tauschii subsp. strangulata]|nr:nucleolar protein 58 isoform X1 [Aegilops tauschii subsp. strangulata]XP_020171479.1 nucleolar protein 58 isoform X1 [Aegilops tauschii subsp. strangulata]XP_020171480.1 nucleolar protein 58 isoform X1 [Aegilops tauschii subsp. strangulata]XP_020171481.1 nucleolar protein 58 isoform X1 [Aegilops tauschii subsp. strangulata]XP_020171482.1 nucleolar protein 58 isoform X1 [Aegilops tauschii subsp. strangulata]XP_020171483.1 nucleolar protein 58 isoform X1 [Aegilops tauschii subsp. strangulata]